MSESTITSQCPETGYAFAYRLFSHVSLGTEINLPRQRPGEAELGPFVIEISLSDAEDPDLHAVDPTVRFTCLDPQSGEAVYAGSFAATSELLQDTLQLAPLPQQNQR